MLNEDEFWFVGGGPHGRLATLTPWAGACWKLTNPPEHWGTHRVWAEKHPGCAANSTRLPASLLAHAAHDRALEAGLPVVAR